MYNSIIDYNPSDNSLGTSNKPFMLRSVRCVGDEPTLQTCLHSGWDPEGTCSGNDVTLKCIGMYTYFCVLIKKNNCVKKVHTTAEQYIFTHVCFHSLTRHINCVMELNPLDILKCFQSAQIKLYHIQRYESYVFTIKYCNVQTLEKV